MTPKERKRVALLALDLAETFAPGKQYSYRIQEAEDDKGARTTVILRIAYSPDDAPVPVRVVEPPRKEVTEGALVTFRGTRHPAMSTIRKARNGWDGWLCTWTTENGIAFTAWHATKDLEVI